MAREAPAGLIAFALLAFGLGPPAAAASPTTGRSATLAQLFPPEEVTALSKTLPGDTEVQFRVRAPAGPGAQGVLVFVSPGDSGELPAQWIEVLDRRHIAWIAADGFGNSRQTAERILVAVMALKLAQRDWHFDARRAYVAGMSGGGRVASQAISHFPQLFDGAIFMAGADFHLPEEAAARALALDRRLVFVSGDRDFNHHEMQAVRDRYRAAGAAHVLWLNPPGLGHDLPDAADLARAFDFLVD